MNKFFQVFLVSLVLVCGNAPVAESKEGNVSIDDRSIEDLPEPIKCYSYLGEIKGDKKMPVGLAVQLCAGTKDAKDTLICYKIAFEALELNRGLAIKLCSDNGLQQ